MRLLITATLGLALIMLPLSTGLVVAGPLATIPSAFVWNGVQWHGATDFDSDGDPSVLEGDGLEGTVDWAVLTKAAFDSAFPGSGYSPPAGELAYTYQIHVAGDAVVSSLSVGLDNQPTGTIGSFSGGGVTGTAPVSTSLAMYSANYSFVGNTVPVGGSSAGLVFSSPHVPMDFFGSLIDHGTSASVIPLPTPSPRAIPEPSTLMLVGLGVLILGCRKWRRGRIV